MTGALILALVFAVLALLLSFSRWLARRPWAAAGNLLVAVVLFVAVFVFWSAAADLTTYRAMPEQGPIAEVSCERTGPHSYRVTLTRLPDGRMQLFEVHGDEWRLDIRTIAWRDQAASLGLRAGYRLDRLSARFVDPAPSGATDAGPVSSPSSYELGESDEAGEDVWAQARTGVRWQRYADARHAYGPWQPLADAGRFEVWLRSRGADGGTDLETRAVNEAAAKAVQAVRPVVATR